MPRTVRVCLSGVLGVFALGAAGCGGRLPVPQFPQLQAVGEIREYGTERLRASDACRGSSASVEVYVACMHDKGWEFIRRENLYPAPECWTLRTAGDPQQMPTAQCFQPATVPAAPAPGTPTATP